MANLQENDPIYQVSSGCTNRVIVPLEATIVCFEGSFISHNAAGYGILGGASTSGVVAGRAMHAAGSATSSQGEKSVEIGIGQFAVNNAASAAAVTQAYQDKIVWASDDNTASVTPSGSVLGICRGLLEDGRVLVEIGTSGALLAAGYGEVDIPLLGAILAAGTPMAAFADNASSNPGVTLVDSEGVGIRWNNNASQTAVWSKFCIPYDCDVGAGATLVAIGSKTGATAGDAVTFTVTAFNQAVGALHDGDANFGSATTAMTGAATAKTVQQVTAAVAAGDLGAAGTPVSISFKPTDGTLGTDDVVLFALKFRYRRKVA
jgi:hypothetical protein